MDLLSLPLEVRAKIAELDLELSEGDITQKGYEKKKAKLLSPYLNCATTELKNQNNITQENNTSRDQYNQKKANCYKRNRRDDRYRSNIHTEAVNNALKQKKQGKRVPVLPLPVKRKSIYTSMNVSFQDSSDDDTSRSGTSNNMSTVDSATSITSKNYNINDTVESTASSNGSNCGKKSTEHANFSLRKSSKLQSANPSPQPTRRILQQSTPPVPSPRSSKQENNSHETTKHITPLTQKIADIMPQILPGGRPFLQHPPDVAIVNPKSNVILGRLRTNNKKLSKNVDADEDISVTKVSAKIQQLLMTLKRPKKKPLAEYFQDDEEDLLESVLSDESVPKCKGSVTSVRDGESISKTNTSLPHSLEAAIHRFGSANPKSMCLSQVDMSGKISQTLTYGKLLSRMKKIAYTLLQKKYANLQPGDKVALVFPNSEPINFMCTLYGCLLAQIVPVVVEVPMSSNDPGSARLGFLLSNCGVKTALTSESCFKLLPKNEKGEIHHLKGWPKLNWILTTSRHLSKPPSNWEATAPSGGNSLLYIEYRTVKHGSVVGVTHTREVIQKHCTALVSALSYNKSDVLVNLLDFKKGFGLMHGFMVSVFMGMHVYSIPYSLMKINPISWMQIVTKYQASIVLAKSRDLHWTLSVNSKQINNVDMKTVRMMLISDGANPWSIGACELFVMEHEKRNLDKKVVCPCSWSPEALTVSVRRPGTDALKTAISLSHLSYNIVKEETSGNPSVVLQDCGNILPTTSAAVVSTNDSSLCKTDQVGEIILTSQNKNDITVERNVYGSHYYGLKGMSDKTFCCKLKDEHDDRRFIRTGLIGYIAPNGRMMVTGKVDGIIRISGKNHNADDLVATVLAINFVRIIHKGRIAVFSVPVLRDERLVIIVEQKQNCSEEDCFKWMSSVIQAMDTVHGVGVYCLSLVSPNGIPRNPLGGIHLTETRCRFLEGNLKPRNILMSPHQCILNLPKPRTKHNDIGPASILQGQVVKGVRLAEACGMTTNMSHDDTLQYSGTNISKKREYLAEILKWRASNTPDHVLYNICNNKGQISNSVTCAQLHKRADKVSQLLFNEFSTGDVCCVLLPPSIEMIQCFYACLFAGLVPVLVKPPDAKNKRNTLSHLNLVLEASKASVILTSSSLIRVLKSKDCQQMQLPTLIDMDETPRKKLVNYTPPTNELIAYIDYNVNSYHFVAGMKMSHNGAVRLCRSIKLQCEFYPSRSVALCMQPYNGMGIALWCLSGIYSGHQSILLPPSEVENNAEVFLQMLSQHKCRDVFINYNVMKICVDQLAPQIPHLKQRGISLSQVRTLVVVTEERPRVQLSSNFTKLFRDLQLMPRVLSTSFGCSVNPAICLQGSSYPDPSTVYIDLRALRNDRVSLVEKGSPHSLCLMETGKILPGVKVVVADTATLGQCGDSKLGEIWVASNHNSQGYHHLTNQDKSTLNQHFNARLKTGDTGTDYARTGYLGFLRRTEVTNASGDRHDALYVVGSMNNTLEVCGMRYHPIDIENSVVRSTNKINHCAVFHSTNLLVVVVELNTDESHALDLVPMVTSVILEEHYVIPGVVAVVDPDSIPINCWGEKERVVLKNQFLSDVLDPIYVAYNM